MQSINPTEIAPPVGAYSHAVSASGQGQWLHVAGQIGIDAGGRLCEGFEAQARQAWMNLMAVLAAAGMDASHLVKVNSYLVDARHLPLLGPVRQGFLGEARPASTLVVAQALAAPQWLFEVDAVAFKPC
ncbi:RidA family protein [Diaphorobacter ruginosibacter]|uniref:RidA family protein n=1 Tax=Diaphorobacter ruginosibacter TaxID=1715720 RepID=UPI00333ED926